MSVRQSFLFNALFALGINFTIKPLWVFGIDRSVQNQLGSESYGMYFAIFSYTYLFQILLDFGLQNFNQTEIGADNSKFKELLPSTLTAKLLLSLSYLLVTIAIGFFLGYASYSFFPWLIFNQVLLSFNVFLRSNISAHRLFIQDSFLSILDKSLMIIGGLFMLIPSIQLIELSIGNFVWIQTISLLITSILCIYFNLRLAPLKWQFNSQPVFSIFKQSIPFAVIYFLMSVFYRIDTVMIEQLLGNRGATEAGIYAQSYRIMESVNNIGYIVAGLLLPLFAYHFGRKESVHKVLHQSYHIMLVIITPIVLGGVFYAQEIIHSLYPSETGTYSSTIFSTLLINFIPVGFLYVLGPLLTAKKSFSVMIPSLFIATILNITCNYVLIPQYGAWGAALTTLGTQSFVLVVYLVASMYIFKLRIKISTLLKTLIYIVGTWGFITLLKNTEIFWFASLLLLGIGSLLLAVLLKIISKETLTLKIGS